MPLCPSTVESRLDVIIDRILSATDGTRHRLGLGDHDVGPRRRCGPCRSDAYLTVHEIMTEEVRKGRSGDLADLDLTTLTRARICSRAIDATRRDRVARGYPARSRQQASAKVVIDALDRAWEAGRLSADPGRAAELLFRVIEHLTTPGDRSEEGSVLPWTRLGRGLGPVGDDLDVGVVARLWAEVEAAVTSTPAGARHHERSVGRPTQNLAVAADLDADRVRPLAEIDPHLSWFDGVEAEATATVRRTGGAADAVLAGLIDRDLGSGGSMGAAAHVRQLDPAAWRSVVRRIEAAAHG